MTSGLRERKKDDTRRALSDAAVRLCLERGYHAVTVAEIADAAGVSRRTFSNYFPGKAECVVGFSDGVLDDVLDVVDAAPAHYELDELLRLGLAGFAERLDTGLDAFMLLVQREDELRTAALAADIGQVQRTAEAITALVGAPPDDLRAQAIAATAPILARMAGDRWIAAGPAGRPGRTDRPARRGLLHSGPARSAELTALAWAGETAPGRAPTDHRTDRQDYVMATLLYRLGAFAARRRWAFLISWVVILAVVGGGAMAFKGVDVELLHHPRHRRRSRPSTSSSRRSRRPVARPAGWSSRCPKGSRSPTTRRRWRRSPRRSGRCPAWSAPSTR